jgi:hypothetical protein
MGASGSMNYSVPSGSFYVTGEMLQYEKKTINTGLATTRDFLKPQTDDPGEMLQYKKKTINTGLATPKNDQPFQAASVTITNTITQALTVKYFQRVFDAGLSVYCYYTKTSIDATPASGETSPNYTGAISDHSVVKILEIY